jgi:hypothetical protein
MTCIHITIVSTIIAVKGKFLTTVMSGAPQIDMQEIIGITLGVSGAPENTDLVHRYYYQNSTLTIYNKNMQLRQILTREYMAR